jgi:hypothetical protein
LRQGRESIGAMTEIIYADISGPLKNVAEFSVEAHLIKLIREGRVKQEGQRYRLLN